MTHEEELKQLNQALFVLSKLYEEVEMPYAIDVNFLEVGPVKDPVKFAQYEAAYENYLSLLKKISKDQS